MSSNSELNKSITKNELSDEASRLKTELNELNSKFNSFLNNISENGSIDSKASNGKGEFNSLNMTTKMYVKGNGSDDLPERIFVKRNSLLTEMFKVTHIRTIRHIFISIMMVLAFQVIFMDLTQKGRIDLNFDLIFWCFDKFSIVIYTWTYMMLSTSCLVYYCFQYWANNRIFYIAKNLPRESFEIKNKKIHINKYDTLWATVYVVYLLAFIILPGYVVVHHRLPTASALVVLLEQMRMLMKTHAFVRSNTPRALANGLVKLSLLNSVPKSEEKFISDNQDSGYSNYDSCDSHDEDDDMSNPDECSRKGKNLRRTNKLCPNFSRYLFFLFAPTLVYKDNYPRTSRIRWNYVFTNFAQVLGAVLYTYYIFARFCIPVFQHFNTEHVTFEMFIKSILNCTLPGTLLLLVAFFAFLHCWLNAFAEMLRFADRMFYKDWWNSTNYSNYYRTWNVVVHDWLYTYIYRDSYYLLGKNYKITCQFLIFLISAAFHEYVLTLAFGFFYPVLFIMFGAVGFGCMFLKSDKNAGFWNLIMWIGLLIGLGGLMCLYSIEWYARQNCPKSFESTIVDYLLPRSFTCGMGTTSARLVKTDL